MSPCRMVPNAPWMWPMCAASRTAVSGSAILTSTLMACLLRRRRLKDEPSDGSVGAGPLENGGAFVVGLRKEDPAGRDRAGPTGQLGPSFKSVSSTGRERDVGSCHKGPRRSNGLKRHCARHSWPRRRKPPASKRSVTPQTKYVNLKMTVIARGPQGDAAAVSIKPGTIS